MSAFAHHLQSGWIRLRVGDSSSAKQFAVHRSLLSQHLAGLHVSPHERYVDIEGDEDSIAYLLEFVYTGDYKPAILAEVSEKSHHVPEKPGSEHQQELHPMVLASRTSTLGVWGRPAAIHTRYWRAPPSAEHVPTHISNKAGTHHGSPTAQHKRQSDVAASFLVHTNVYLLAERYGASGLKDFALQKLMAAIKASGLEERTDHASSLVELIRSVYHLTSTGDDKDAETRQKLRQIVLVQAVNSLPDLQDDAGFKGLLKEGGDFVEDLLCHLTKVRLALQ